MSYFFYDQHFKLNRSLLSLLGQVLWVQVFSVFIMSEDVRCYIPLHFLNHCFFLWESKTSLETHSGLLSFEKYEAFILENISASRAYWYLPDQVLDKKGIFNRDLALIKSELQFLFFVGIMIYFSTWGSFWIQWGFLECNGIIHNLHYNFSISTI